ncbi:MAG: hypothetical protein ACPGVU_03750 [Limisphaerales bacterium]
MAAQREIERLIGKYRLHREARAGGPLVVDERTRDRLMSVVEDQYGTSGFVSSQEAAEKYAESLAWQKGGENWWHRMVPWIGFAGVCCLALVVIFVAANHGEDSKQALVKGPDLMDEVEHRSKAPAAPVVAPTQPALKDAGRAEQDDSAAGAVGSVNVARPTKSAPRPKQVAPSAIVITAPLPDPSAPMAEEPIDARRQADASVVTAPRVSPARSIAPSKLDADTTPASSMVPVGARSSSAKKAPVLKPSPKRMSNKVAIAPLPPPRESTAQAVSPMTFDPAPATVDLSNPPIEPITPIAPSGPVAKALPRANRDRQVRVQPPQTPIVWENPKRAAATAGGRSAPGTEVNAPASTPRMQRFRSTGPVVYRRKINATTGFVIMGQFDLLTSGSRITVKDADGSIYSGRVSSAQADRFAFHVEGVNRTSKQRVGFTGSYSPTGSSPDGLRQRTTGAGLQGEIKVGGGQPGKLTARRIR